MNTRPKLTVSGYRGIWGESLTESIARDFTRAFAEFTRKRNDKPILIGRDGRESGPELSKIVANELMLAGKDVIDLGMIPTPVVLFLVRSKNAGGAIIITASHNPIEYNGLKFITESGMFTSENEVAEIESLRGRSASPTLVPAGQLSKETGAFETYLDHLLGHIDVASIRSKKYKVSLDPINSVGSTTTPMLLSKLGATYTIINDDPTKKFAHEPEPLPKNLTGLCTLVRESGSAVGFAQDPDGDRLVISDENGDIPTEEIMLALCVQAQMLKHPGPIAINLSTSSMSEVIGAQYGMPTFRSKVGERNVSALIQKEGAVIGGEGSGGVIWPQANLARDSFVGICLILELMAKEDKPLSEIIAGLPRFVMLKEKIAYEGDIAKLYQNLLRAFPEAKSNTEDGLRLDFADNAWLHVRPSNTEPVIRLIVEAKTEDTAREIMEKAKRALY